MLNNSPSISTYCFVWRSVRRLQYSSFFSFCQVLRLLHPRNGTPPLSLCFPSHWSFPGSLWPYNTEPPSRAPWYLMERILTRFWDSVGPTSVVTDLSSLSTFSSMTLSNTLSSRHLHALSPRHLYFISFHLLDF